MKLFSRIACDSRTRSFGATELRLCGASLNLASWDRALDPLVFAMTTPAVAVT